MYPVIRVVESPHEWLRVTEGFRATDPVIMNLLGSVAEGVVNGITYESALWLVIEEGDEVIGCAIRTAPWPAVISPMPEHASLALGTWFTENAQDVFEVTGPIGEVLSLAEAREKTVHIRVSEYIRVLTDLSEVSPCPGRMRLAHEADLPLLLAWFERFHHEADLAAPASDERVRASLRDERLWVWENDGMVAMGGHAPLVTTTSVKVGRIGPIYTDPSHRGHGYATALTHAIAANLKRSCDIVMLFTDAGNPTSNHIYERLGFTIATEMVEAHLGD